MLNLWSRSSTGLVIWYVCVGSGGERALVRLCGIISRLRHIRNGVAGVGCEAREPVRNPRYRAESGQQDQNQRGVLTDGCVWSAMHAYST
jgi:hypothetical protein